MGKNKYKYQCLGKRKIRHIESLMKARAARKKKLGDGLPCSIFPGGNIEVSTSSDNVGSMAIEFKMHKKEVDTRLFITCRLCVDDLGVYQIVPDVKEQILYCFDINVDPFDALPQLICKKCEAILNDFTETKKNFIKKQNDLKKIINESHNDFLSQTQPEKESIEKVVECKTNDQNLKGTRKRRLCISSSSSDSELDKGTKDNDNDSDMHKENGTKDDDTDSDMHKDDPAWPSNYTKKYACRYCNVRYLSMTKLKAHVNSKHFSLKKKYRNIFKRHCEVRLNKIDDKLNITGSRNKVMLERDKIIENADQKYYVIYTTKGNNDEASRYSVQEEKAWSSKTKKTVIRKPHESSDSSDDEIVAKRKRTKRLFSRSSNETVVLDTANKSNISDNDKDSQSSRTVASPVVLGECISIEDSSDSELENAEGVSKTKKEDLTSDEVTINNIITTCQNKYIKKHYNDNSIMKCNKNPAEIAIQLKRKFLSIGRKLINKKKGFNCTPLLRFMECKNLDIAWIPQSTTQGNQELNNIRIWARKKNFGGNFDYKAGWKDYKSASNLISILTSDPSNTSKADNLAEILRREPDNVANGTHNSGGPCVSSISEAAIGDSAVLIAEANLSGTDTKKLLNANPVANPKQLPKKSTVNENKTVKNIAAKQVVSNIEAPLVENNEYNTEPELCMPIITSTTSLAVPENNNTSSKYPEDNNSKNDGQKTEAHRIKVKNMSELMSAEMLNLMNEPVLVPSVVSTTPLPVQIENSYINVYIPPMTSILQFQHNSQQNNNFPVSFAPEPSWKNDYMILDTTELPNTTTNSPFQYFTKLLLLYDITLLDTDVELSNDFHCLIKFKVMYKQEANSDGVTLCLSLFCAKNVFCMKIKDRNQENINISRISPNWQWEVLKIYKGEVVNKLIVNAQKISQEVSEFTKRFVCLLKSINIKS